MTYSKESLKWTDSIFFGVKKYIPSWAACVSYFIGPSRKLQGEEDEGEGRGASHASLNVLKENSLTQVENLSK